MHELTWHELDCLAKIHNETGFMSLPCPDHILDRLETAGLIEQSPALRLPLEHVRSVYRPTLRGLDVLARHGLA